MKFTFNLIAILSISQLVLSNLTTTQVLDEAEQALTDIVTRSKALYGQRCSSSNISCDTKLYDECSVFAPEMTCESDFPFSSKCEKNGAFMSWDIGGGRCSNYASCNSQADKEIICSQSNLFDEGQYSELKHDSTSPIVYKYVGFYNSFRTIYPYQHFAFIDDNANRCEEYDPRFRPWYVGAATGAKNVILVIDTSGSMGMENRLSSAKIAARAVINTLGQQDWFGIVTFSTNASRWQNSLQVASQENKYSALDMINSLTANGMTNYEDAFEETFGIYDDTIESERGSTCIQTVVLFLTDGTPTQGNQDIDSLIEGITTLNNERAVIFTYALGSGADPTITDRIACQNNGISYEISDAGSQSNLVSSMRSYYDYLASGLDRTEAVWSESYTDYLTGKTFITASMPIYQNQGDVRLLLGVAGVDIDLDTIKDNNDFTTVVNERQGKTRYGDCTDDFIMEECQLRKLRGGNTCGSLEECDSYEGNFNLCNDNISANPWVTSHSSGKEYDTCKLTPCCPTDEKCDFGNVLQFSLIILGFVIINMLFV